jgi:hypothetical protein
MNTEKFELKYCERCGTLKLRPVTSNQNCCKACAHLLERYRLGKRARAIIANGIPIAPASPVPAAIPAAVAEAAAGRAQ